jgi:hypothetical protein
VRTAVLRGADHADAVGRRTLGADERGAISALPARNASRDSAIGAPQFGQFTGYDSVVAGAENRTRVGVAIG